MFENNQKHSKMRSLLVEKRNMGVTPNHWPTTFSSFFFMSLTWSSRMHDERGTFFMIFECFWSFSTMQTHVQACICWLKYTTTLSPSLPSKQSYCSMHITDFLTKNIHPNHSNNFFPLRLYRFCLIHSTSKLRTVRVIQVLQSLFWTSTREFSCLLVGDTSQGRGSEWAGIGSYPPNNYN